MNVPQPRQALTLKSMALSLVLSLLMTQLAPALALAANTSWSQPTTSPAGVASRGFDYESSILPTFDPPRGRMITSIEADGEDVRLVLLRLAQRSGINLVLDPAMEGFVSISLSGVTVNEAIKAIAMMNHLDIVAKPGDIYLLVPQDQAVAKGLSRRSVAIIPLKHANAARLARLLNRTVFSDPLQQQGGGLTQAAGATGGQQDPQQAVRADMRTNSLVASGTDAQIATARRLAQSLDQPREMRTYQLSYANALDAALQLSSSVFNDGVNPMMPLMGGGGGGGGGGQGGGTGGGGGGQGQMQQDAQPSPLRVTQEKVEEGVGINLLSSGGGSSSGGESSGGSSGSSDSGSSGGGQGSIIGSGVAIRNIVKESTFFNINPDGPMVIPDTRQNTLTIFATASQLADAERLLPMIDARPPQVSIEASLVELSQTAAKELGSSFAAQGGKTIWSFNNLGALGNTLLNGGNASAGLAGLISDNINPESLFAFRLQALMRQGKARNLANPTVVATHDSETLISIVDEIRRGDGFNTQSFTAAGGGFASTVPLIGQAGIVLDIVPKIGEDGYVTLRIRPSISSVYDTQQTGTSIVQLLRRRDLLAQAVRVKDGETLMLGGLVDNRDTQLVSKLPGLGDLPIVGAMLRSQTTNRNRSELVMLVTPHILNTAEPTPIHVVDTPTEAVKQFIQQGM